MAKCIVPSCRSINRELFCSPDDKNKLRKWQQILQVNQSSFLVCDIHFVDKYIRFEKFITQDAFPSILVTPEEYCNDGNNNYCQSCLKVFEASSTKISVNEKIQKMFFKRTSFEITLNSFLCDVCHAKFVDFETFVSSIRAKHELKMSSGVTRIKSEQVDLDDDDNECPELYPIQNLEITHHDNDDPEILKEVLGRHEIVRQQTTPLNGNAQSRHPKIQTLKIQSGRRTSLLVPKIQECDESEQGSSSNLSQPESTNSPMVIIPDYRRHVRVSESLARKIRSRSIHEKKQLSPELNNSIQHDHSITINQQNVNTKRRNSYASSADSEDTSNKRLRAQFQENQSIPCGYCPMHFGEIETLKLHLDEVHKSSPLKAYDKPENFRCTDCNEGFTSYYYLRKHKDCCEYSLRFKCSQQYCRFRAATVDEINNHMLDAHFSQTRCKVCKLDFDSQELYKIHEIQEHSKKERGRKPKIEVRPDYELKKILAHGESSEDDKKVQCLQCSELISPEMLSFHIKQHLDESN
ncbi:unnamed protein product [Chironomus riparius]|uniref:C2H2-type domain-containing protein n=1 Tax=Chironomus riparius TaxID=315576 RepID=A0A9N9RXE9_9DIPT|nr:unnamed protein product [Chironomus riparius]